MKMSLIVLGALAVSLLLRHRSAAVRHWVLAAAVACAAALPVLEAIIPAWSLPFTAPAMFERYEDIEQTAVSVPPAPSRNAVRDLPSRTPPSAVSSGPFDVAGAVGRPGSSARPSAWASCSSAFFV